VSESNRNDIILAAINAVGQVPEGKDWEAEVTLKAIEIAVLTGEKSNVGKAVDVVLDPETKVFKGTVVEVEKEQSSTRGIITLDTGNSREAKHSITKQPLPAGQEQIRTDRTDGALGKALAIKARNLKFHSVLVWVEVEAVPGKDFKVRVLRHIQDLGIDPAYAAQAQAAATAAAPAQAPAAVA
jgi:hypothetical protein